jgi:Ca2+-dependent lipid-binding protein
MDNIYDRLEVKVIEGSGISITGQVKPNCYAVVQCGFSSQQTLHVIESVSPQWNSPVMIFTGLLAHNTSFITVTLYNKDVIGNNDYSLGMVAIPLDTVYNSPQIAIDDWYTLDKSPDEKLKAAGSVRLILTYWNVFDKELSLVEGVENEEIENPPNLLVVKLISGDMGNQKNNLETFVIVQVGDQRQSSKTIKKTKTPVWNEDLLFPLTNGDQSIVFIAKHQSYVQKIFLGQCRVSVTDVAANGDYGHQFTFQLANENFVYDAENRGEIVVHMKWIYDREYDDQHITNTQEGSEDKAKRSTFSSLFGKKEKKMEKEVGHRMAGNKDVSSMIAIKSGGKGKSTTGTDDDDANGGGLTPVNAHLLNDQEEAESRKRSEMIQVNASLEKASLDSYDDIKDGSYSVQVHVIECHDIKGVDSSGLSDLIVYVEVMGEKQHTKVVDSVSSCFFDDTFYFNFTDVKGEQIVNGTLTISVYDSNTFRPNVLIGSYSIDLAEVYHSNHHEVYRQWVSITNTKSKNKSGGGTLGNVKYSCTVLAGGDKQVYILYIYVCICM